MLRDIATHKNRGDVTSASSCTTRKPQQKLATVDYTKYGNKFEYTSRMYNYSTRTDKPDSFSGICLN